MTLYRLGTEDFPNLESIVSGYFDFFNVNRGIGSWKGMKERSATIEIMTDDPLARQRVLSLAQDIRERNCQEKVLVMALDVLQAQLV